MKLYLTILFSFLSFLSFSQNGTVTGIISDKDTKGEPLGFANVKIKGTNINVSTGVDGKYKLSVPAGNHILVVSFLGYESKETPFNLKQGESKTINVTIGTGAVTMEDVVIKKSTNREKESVLLLEQKKAVEIKQSIGAQEMSRKGASDAAAAVTKVTGIAKQEGVKNVFVRGLGDRYNATTLNGYPLPSEDPEYKNIALEFFGTNVIKTIGVNKVFTANKIGDVGGATIDIVSKDLDKNFLASLDISAGINSQVVSKKDNFLAQSGVNYFGFSNKKDSGGDITKFNFKNSLDPTINNTPYNHSFGFSLGKKFNIGENKLSLLFVGSHSVDFAYTSQITRNTTTTGTIFQDMLGDKYSKTINQLGLFNLEYKTKKGNKYSYNFLGVHNNNQYVAILRGKDTNKFQSAEDLDFNGYLRRQQNNDNLLFVNQLNTNVNLTKLINVNAGVSYSNVIGAEPDRRINYLNPVDKNKPDEYIFSRGNVSQARYYLNLNQKDLSPKFELTYKLGRNNAEDKISVVKFGYNGRMVTDKFYAIEYDMRSPLVTVTEPFVLDNYFNQNNLDNNLFALDRNIDKYDTKKYIHSGFGDFTYQIYKNLVVNIGTSIDKVDLIVNYNVNKGGTVGSSYIKEFFVLPSANIKLDINDKNSLRLASSKTYTMPQSKEISPYRYIDISFISQGNENLKPSNNYNLDLKWDYYISKSELISLTGFYKHIDQPIARVEEGGAGGFLTYKNVAENAKLLGAEFEARKNIFNIEGNFENKLVAGLNISYIYSQLELDVLRTPKRMTQLEGASPLLANFDITSTIKKDNKEFTNTIVANYFSDRIYTIGTLSYKDIIEKSVIGLDFISSSKLNKHLSIKFKAKNILNPDFILSRKGAENNDDVVLRSFKKGINLSLGVSYDF